MKLFQGYKDCAQREVSTRHIDILDGVRALAIFIVAWYHIWQQSWMWPGIHIDAISKTLLDLDPLVRNGYIMVDVMLLISGFLLFLPYARHMVEGGSLPSIKEFFIKRALRILPSYWLCVFTILFFFALPAHGWKLDATLAKDLFTHLTFTQVFSPHTYISTELNVVLWTLAVEVQFYLVFPLLARAFVKWPLRTWAVMTAAGLAFRTFVVLPSSDTTLLVNQLPAFMDVYANGMLASLCYVHIARSIKHNKWTRLTGTCVSLIMVAAIWQLILKHTLAFSGEANYYELIRIFQTNIRFLLSAYMCVFIIAAANAGAGLRYLLSNKIIRVFSAISLQFYMWHQYLAVKMHYEWNFPPSASSQPHADSDITWQWLFTLCAFGFPILLSLALTYGFEQPISKAIWNVWVRRKERIAASKESISKTT